MNDNVEEPLVSIVCITYNQEDYIRECLDGLVMQNTDFQVEILVNDDASTDNTPYIIREYEIRYPSLFHVIYQTENQYSKGVSPWLDILFPIARGKYIALCEGDDYWTDPYKLQKQIEILEKNTAASFVYTDFQTVDSNGCFISRPLYDMYASKSYSGDIFYRLMRGNFVLTLTTCFRKDVLLCRELKSAPAIIDYLLFLVASAKGEAVYIPQKTGCYRQQPGSLMSTAPMEVNDRTLMAFKYISELYIKGKISQRRIKTDFLIKTFIMRRAIGLYLQHDSTLFHAIVSDKKSLWIYVIPALLELSICRLFRLSKR